MSVLQISVIVICLAFFLIIIRAIYKNNLLLRYALIWFLVGAVALAAAIYPPWVYWLANLLGFDLPSNFVMFIGIFFLLIITLSLSVIVSKQTLRIKTLIQQQAIQENKHRTASSENQSDESS